MSSHFIQIGNWDVTPLLLQLQRNEQLWNSHKDRTQRTGSVHAETSDIWLRYRPLAELNKPSDYNEPFSEMVWYPAHHALPEIRPLTQALMSRTQGTALGGTLITRLPPGSQVYPHTDKASWHARYFNTKVYTILQANADCINYVENQALVMRPGECWVFDNLKMHAVLNNGTSDRITLITSIRCD